MNDKVNAKVINDYIKSSGLTKKEFCRLCGINTTALYRVLKGENYSFTAIMRISLTTGIPMRDLLILDLVKPNNKLLS